MDINTVRELQSLLDQAEVLTIGAISITQDADKSYVAMADDTQVMLKMLQQKLASAIELTY